MTDILLKDYKKTGLRILVCDLGQYVSLVDAIMLEKKILIRKFGRNRWAPFNYPYFLCFEDLSEEDHIYLRELIETLTIKSDSSAILHE